MTEQARKDKRHPPNPEAPTGFGIFFVRKILSWSLERIFRLFEIISRDHEMISCLFEIISGDL